MYQLIIIYQSDYFLCQIEAKLQSLREATNWQEFMDRLKETAAEITSVSEMATLRLQARKSNSLQTAHKLVTVYSHRTQRAVPLSSY